MLALAVAVVAVAWQVRRGSHDLDDGVVPFKQADEPATYAAFAWPLGAKDEVLSFLLEAAALVCLGRA